MHHHYRATVATFVWGQTRLLETWRAIQKQRCSYVCGPWEMMFAEDDRSSMPSIINRKVPPIVTPPQAQAGAWLLKGGLCSGLRGPRGNLARNRQRGRPTTPGRIDTAKGRFRRVGQLPRASPAVSCEECTPRDHPGPVARAFLEPGVLASLHRRGLPCECQSQLPTAKGGL